MSNAGGAAYTRVWQIHSMLHPRPDDLISTSRFFIREGEMYVWSDKKRKKQLRYFFLFNDIMLLTKRESHKKYWLRIHITLRSPYVSIEDIENSSYNQEIRLHCKSRSFILYAPSDDLRREWIDDIRASIAGTHKEELASKEVKKKGDELLSRKSDTGKVAPPTLTQTGKKPNRVEESDDDESEEEQRRPRRKTTGTGRKPRKASTASQGSNYDVFEYPALGYNSNPNMVRPGSGYVHSSPGTFNNSFVAGNPFLTSDGSSQGGNPFAMPSNQGSMLALGGGSQYSTAPSSNPFGAQPTSFSTYGSSPTPVNPFAPQPQPTPAFTSSPFGQPSQPFGSAQPFNQPPHTSTNPFF